MGKGDKKTRRGKIVIGSTGVRRPRKKKGYKPVILNKAETKPKETLELNPVMVIPEIVPVVVVPEIVPVVVVPKVAPVVERVEKKTPKKTVVVVPEIAPVVVVPKVAPVVERVEKKTPKKTMVKKTVPKKPSVKSVKVDPGETKPKPKPTKSKKKAAKPGEDIVTEKKEGTES